MTDLTATDRQDIQARLEDIYNERVERYKNRLAFFKERTDEKDLTTGRAAFELGKYIDAVATSESLLDQFNRITHSKFTDTERQDFHERLERRKTRLIENYRDLRATRDLMIEAAEDVVKIDALIRSFNAVTQAQLKATAGPVGNTGPGHILPRMRGH